MWGKNKYSPFVMLNGVKHLFIIKADGKRVLRENADRYFAAAQDNNKKIPALNRDL